ncbi:MAG: tol-pal system YbgF family protein, partial [Pseudobdellovibrionaceae bacterium]
MQIKTSVLTTTLVLLLGANAKALVQALISQQGDTVHLEFEGQNQWDYDLQKIDQKGKTIVQLTLPKMDEKSSQQIQNFSHALIQKVDVNPDGPDGKVILSFQMNGQGIEPFDYLTEKPSRLIIDFYKGQGSSEKPEKKKTAVAPKTEKVTPPPQALAEKSKKKVDRAPASPDVLVINEQGRQVSLNDALAGKKSPTGSIFDGGDPNFERFSIKDFEMREEAVIASRHKVYLDFPMLRMQSPYFELLQTRKPAYEIAPQDTEENKQARLLLTLFENKRYHVFLKTVDWFFQKFPESQYDEMMKFMLADSLFGIWTESHKAEDFDLAMLRYRQALEKYPESPLLERTMMLMGFATLDRGDYLGTLRLFQSHLQKRPQSPNKDIARFAIADSFLKINRYDEATQVYDEIEKDAFQEKDKIQAAYLKGDVAHQKKDFRKAIEDYQTALSKYPQASPEFPNAIYNQAAAYFGLKEYKKSLDLYGEFIKKFPTHSEAGFAMTRIGELQDILGASPEKVLGTYLETYFRYGDSPSAVVARLRML